MNVSTAHNDILQRDNPTLRAKARAITTDEIGTPHLQSIIDRLKTAMHSQKDGVAIAAPQIGESLQLFIVNGALLKQADETFKGDERDLVFINPKITKYSKEKRKMEEGCLSVRWLYGKVRRSTRVQIEALNEKGEKIDRGASGLLAQIFQHETDHLHGVLFTDNADEVWEMSEEEIKELTSTP